MTKEEWNQVENALKIIYRTVELSIDGYKVELRLERVSTYKNRIMIYINGSFKYRWIIEDCEERRRFLQHKQPYVMPSKQRAEFKKMSKRAQKEYAAYYERRYDIYNPQWSSFGALKKHLIENNTNIELIRIS